MPDPPLGVRLVPFATLRDLPQLRIWLHRPHVARWWGDPDEALALVNRHAATDHAIIAVDGRAVGYLCWQKPTSDELSAAGLTDLPVDHIDVDILIGEAEFMGRGIGPRALDLLLDRLWSQGACSIGMGVAAANERAARAYEKAGFHLFRAFQEDDQDMRYYVRSL